MLLERAGLDAWIVSAREYNEDPVLQTMVPATWLKTARRRTILLFLREGKAVDRMAVARYQIGSFPSVWDPASQPDQWAAVAEILRRYDPATIGVDRSPTFALADGLSSSEMDRLRSALGNLADRLVSADAAVIGWLETRLPAEVALMSEACARAHEYLARALSPEVIKPGETTTADVEWWLRDAVDADSLSSWFHPTTSVQRRDQGARDSFADRPDSVVIQAGDLVHIDFGIVWKTYHTDQQQHGYVLLPDESEPPQGLAEGLAAGNRLQNILVDEYEVGRTGNEVLASALDRARSEGIDPMIYTHPIGVHGHAAGPTIGLWDQQDGVAGSGDYALWPNTGYSIELQARHRVPEWDNQTVQFMLEEDAFFDGEDIHWLDERQTRLHLI